MSVVGAISTVRTATPGSGAVWDLSLNAPSATFVSATDAAATFDISMPSYADSAHSDAKYTVEYSVWTKNPYTASFDYVKQQSIFRKGTDQSRVSVPISVPRGQKTLWGVRVAVFDGVAKVAESALSGRAIANASAAVYSLIPIGKGAYNGLAIMTQADQGIINFPTTTAKPDVRSIFNRTTSVAGSTGFVVDASCQIQLALGTSLQSQTGSFLLKDSNMDNNSLYDASFNASPGFTKAIRFRALDEDGVEIASDITTFLRVDASFNELNKDPRYFDLYTIRNNFAAMKSYTINVYRDLTNSTTGEKILDVAPSKFTVTPAVPFNARKYEPVAGNGVLNNSFELIPGTVSTEVNGDKQKKAINAQGGLLNTVFVRNFDGTHTEIASNSAANFTSVTSLKGPQQLDSGIKYRNPSYGKTYNINDEWVVSLLSGPEQQVYFGAVPETLSGVTVESVKLTEAIKDGSLTSGTGYGVLISWPKLATGRTVSIAASFDDLTFNDDEEWQELQTGLTGTKWFISHADVMTSAYLSYADYYGQGVTFLVSQVDPAAGKSLPKAVFLMPVGQTAFANGDFDVISGANQITIKYNKTLASDLDARNQDFAGNYEIPATITYMDVSSRQQGPPLTVADITTGNGIVLSDLEDSRSYIISAFINGNVDPSFNLTSTNAGISPANPPKAVSNLKVTPALDGSLNLVYTASVDNGEYASVTPTNLVFVTTYVKSVKMYVRPDLTLTDTRTSFASTSGGTSVLRGLTKGTLYYFEVESTFTLNGHSAQKVSAYASATPCVAPLIVDFRVDAKNLKAFALLTHGGSPVSTLAVFPKGAEGATSMVKLDTNVPLLLESQSKYGTVCLSFDLPAGTTNAVALVGNSQGIHMAAAPESQFSSSSADSKSAVVYSSAVHGPVHNL